MTVFTASSNLKQCNHTETDAVQCQANMNDNVWLTFWLLMVKSYMSSCFLRSTLHSQSNKAHLCGFRNGKEHKSHKPVHQIFRKPDWRVDFSEGHRHRA